MRIRHCLALLPLALVVACGGGDDTEVTEATAETEETEADDSEPSFAEDDYIDAVVADIQSDEEFPLPDDQAECLAAAIVAVPGAEALAEAGVRPLELAAADSLADVDVELPEDATVQLEAALVDCNLGDVITEAFVAGFDGLLSAEAEACIGGEFSADAVSGALARTFIDGDNEVLDGLLVSSLVACPNAMTDVLAAAFVSEGLDPSPDAEECLGAFVAAHADEAAAVLNESADADAFSQAMVAACPALVG